ncbi:zinc finger, CCHC-type containing protein [Tanacetum coccineum]
MMPCAPYWLRVAHVGNYQTLITFLSYTISSRSTALMMAANAQNINNTTIRSERKLTHLEQLPLPLPDAPQAVRDTYEVLNDAQNEVAYLMLGSMSPDLQRENYNMHSMGKKIAKLHTMLKLHEKGILKKAETPVVLAIQEGKIQKDKRKPRRAKGKDKGKNKLAYAPKPKIPPSPKRDNLVNDSICHHCKEVGHWRRNCPSYQSELKKRKEASMASTSGIFTIELHAFPNKTWVYNTGYGTHIYNTLQGLRRSKKLKHGALSLYIGNGIRATVEEIRSFDLILPSGLIIVLDYCHFAPTVTRDVVSIYCLVENGYIYTFMNYGISISKDNVFYFNAILHEGIYEINLHNLYPNVSSTFNVSNKRVKYYLDSSYLWHCRLRYINKKCMDKL